MSTRQSHANSGRAALAAAVTLTLIAVSFSAAAKKPKPKVPGGKHPPPAMPGPAPKASSEPARALSIPPLTIDRVTLDNGLRVVLSADPRATSVAVSMTYDVGARNEERGAAGMASLVERLMFQGSTNVLRGEHTRLVEARGGSSSSTTSSDLTRYVDVAAPSELPLLLWLEADRLKSLQIKDDGVEAQLEVMTALTKLADAKPLAEARTRARSLVFEAFFPYEHAPRPTLSDLAQLKPDGARSFFESFYATNTAVLSIAGDFEPDHAVQLVHRFFDTAKRLDKTPQYVPPQLPEQTSQRTATLEDARLKSPALLLAWAIAPAHTEDHDALEAALDALVGEGGRLSQKLILDKGWASSAKGCVAGLRGPDLLTLEIALLDDAQRADAEKLIEIEVDALAKTGPTDAELARYRQHRERDAWDDAGSMATRSSLLGEYEIELGDARALGTELTRAASVTRERVKAAAARYLSPSRRTLVEVLPPRDPDAPAKKPPVAAPMIPQPKKPAPKTPKRPHE